MRRRRDPGPGRSRDVGAGEPDIPATADCPGRAGRRTLAPLPRPVRSPGGRSASLTRSAARPPWSAGRHAPIVRPAPKPGGGLRWLTQLDPADEAAYRAAVGGLVGRVERSLSPAVIANRAVPAAGGWTLHDWRTARSAWRALLRSAADTAVRGTVFAVTDVRECYPSIRPATVGSVLGPDARETVALLRRFSAAGVRGLPIGPDASAVVANAVLAPLDDAVTAAGARHVRWVDDVALWGSGREVRRALEALRRAAARLGLELHPEKTRLLAGRHELRSIALDASRAAPSGRAT
jgi:hypothetical protein